MKKRRAITHITFAQSVFLNIKFFFQNGLLSYASACSFDLIFSAVPIFIMIILLAVRFLHASPALIDSIYFTVPELKNYFNPEAILHSFQTIKKFSTLEAFLIFSIFWMARRFFASVFASLRNIFHDQQKRRPVINQILVFVFEIAVVFIAVMFVSFYMSIKTIVALPFFQRFPQLDFIHTGILRGKLFSYLPNFLFFVVVTLMYKIGAGTRPKLKLCLASGFICTASFWMFRAILHSFINVSRYNLIYGVLGNVIILLIDIFFFFTFFLFFAQYIFVCQFFDELLLGELYLLPKKEESGFAGKLRRLLFIKPDFLLAKDFPIIYLSAGESIYKDGDKDSNAYYILKGSIKVNRPEFREENYFKKGDFFGELICILGKPRSSTATALEDSQIVRITEEDFRFLVNQNFSVAQKVLGQLGIYFTKYYGTQN